jgi:DNA-binding FadR family transcriptional regulator
MLTDVLDFRRWFGREVARGAAERATPGDLKLLEEIADKAADPGMDVGELLKLDFEFYVRLTDAAKNRVMKLLVNTIRGAVLAYAPFFAQFNPPPQTVRKHHKDVIRAVATKDAEGAAKLADAYLRKGLETVQAVTRA